MRPPARGWAFILPLLLALASAALAARDEGASRPVRHRLMLAEYGRGPNRLLELSADGKVTWEHRFPSIAVIFQVLQNGHVLYGYGGQPTGVQEIDRDHHVVWNYESK